ncbi:MAG: hypothetical protein WBO09_01825 [Methylocystis silviterrae]|uniref:hypothetical protein n=1 Tax=Methylocystis silviterrae TaxID=2743612 RepID=UPI003C7890E7
MSAAAILKLQASGFSSEQVSALADLIDTQAATKADVEASEHRLELKISDLKNDISDVKNSTRADLAQLEATLLKWFIGTAVALVALTVTIEKVIK